MASATTKSEVASLIAAVMPGWESRGVYLHDEAGNRVMEVDTPSHRETVIYHVEAVEVGGRISTKKFKRSSFSPTDIASQIYPLLPKLAIVLAERAKQQAIIAAEEARVKVITEHLRDVGCKVDNQYGTVWATKSDNLQLRLSEGKAYITISVPDTMAAGVYLTIQTLLKGEG